MKSFLRSTAVALLLFTAVANADDYRLFEAEDVFALEWAADPQVSPDGSQVAYVRTAFDKRLDRRVGAIWLVDVDGDNHRPLVADRAAGSPRWSPDGTRLAYRASGNNGAEIRIRFIESGADFAVAQFLEAPGQFAWSPDGKHLAFRMFVPGETPSFAKPPAQPRNAQWAEPVRVFDDMVYRFDGLGWLRKGANHLFVVSTDGGEPRQLTDGENNFGSPAWLDADTLLGVGNDDPDAYLDPIESEIFAIDLVTGERQALTNRDGPDGNPAVSPNSRLVAYLGYDDKVRAYQQTDLYVMNADGSNSRELAADFDHPFSNPQFSADNRSIYATSIIRGHTALVRVDLNGKVTVLTESVGGTAMGRPYASGAYSVARDKTGVIAYTHQVVDRPADLAVILGRGPANVLTDLNTDALAHIDLSPIEEIQVESNHDGRNIEAWIATPPGFTADGSYPMIIEIHGGPFAMYGPSFSAEIQRYAAEGFVTVYANPRGSTGYGDEFAQQIDLAYPSHDHDDLMSVVDALVEMQYVDPERLFITGGSGGGVLTAWAVGKTDRFAAAASIKPVINWASMATVGDIGAMVVRHWMRATPWDNPERYFRLSPISLAGNVTTPTLMMVGEEDWRTPTWEAEQFYGALKLLKVPTALVRIPGSAHFIAARPSQMIAKTDNIMGWFRKYDPANKED